MSESQQSSQSVIEKTKRSETAVKRFSEGCNCSQAVLMAFARRYGLNEAMAMQMSAGLGGGVGRMGEVCGTLTGAALVLGLEMGPKSNLDREAKEATYVATQLLQKRFIERHGSNRCKDLLNKDLSVATEYQQAKELGLFKTQCPNYVETVVSLLEQSLENSE
ncbi:MAG: C-GCAxxG-C-C family protein [Candidatus Thiodiazotropha sp.]|jgi:C_GCAxxG_C_C family probable redox protein